MPRCSPIRSQHGSPGLPAGRSLEPVDRASFWSGLALSVFPLAIYAVAGVSTGASLAVYASAPVLYFIWITLLRWLAPSGSAERQFT